MNIKEIGKKAIIPGTSALLGGAVVVAALKMNPAAMAKLNGEVSREQHEEQIYEDIFKKQASIRRQFESMFNEDLIFKNDPFESWISNKLSGGAANDISKREDEDFVYYDIKVGDTSAASINTKVEKGYINITGTEERKSGAEGKEENASAQSVFKSSFSRTFPLPRNINSEKMQMLSEKNKVILKFPKIKV